VAAIRERRHYVRWEREQWLIWQTRTICTFVAATVPVETAGDTSALLEDAQRIGEPPEPSTPDSAVVSGEGAAAPVAKPGTKTETDEAGRTRLVADPDVNPGTFEMFMGSFGTPQRWAGR